MNLSRLKFVRTFLCRFYSNVHIVFLGAVISFVFYSIFYKDLFLFTATYFVNISMGIRAARNQARNKVVLLYTPFFGNRWTDYVTLEGDKVEFVEGEKTFHDCEVSSCVLTYDQSKLLEADAVGFHARDMPDILPTRLNTQQIWFYFVLENPLNVFVKPDGYAGVFNWTMSYRRESEVYIPYGMYKSIKKEARDFRQIHAPDEKDTEVAWLVSNCNAKERREYVEELQKYINVSIYGKCGTQTCPKERHSLICNALLSRHKFYLAFENGNCPDYITEKYWDNAIDNSIVPVVMGGADYKTLAIPNSYIDVQDFASPKKLAEYLQYLAGNDTAYEEYFCWKKQYQRIRTRRACELCKQLHNQSLYTPSRVYTNLTKFWNRKQCKNRMN